MSEGERGFLETMKARRTGPATWATVGLLLVMGAAFGLEFSMLKLTAEAGFPGTGVLLVTLAIVAIVFSAIVTVRRSWIRPTRDVLVFLLVIALLGYVLPLLAAVWAAPHVPAGVLTLIVSFTPVVSVAVALSFRTERVSPRRIAAVMFGMAAALLILVPEVDLPQAGNIGWLLVVFVVPLTYGIESVYVSVAWPKGLDAMQIGAGQSLVALAAVLPIHLVIGDAMPFDPTWPVGQIAILVVAACIVVEVLLYFVIIGRTGGVLVNFGMYISLFAGIAWGWVIFGERLGLLVWIAVAALAIGLALTIPRRGKSELDP